LERSLKEALGELEARLNAGGYRRFPLIGLKGAAGALALCEAVARLSRPILAVTSHVGEAESLAHDAAFFMGESLAADAPSRRVHLMRAWELKPFAPISPPSDVQASQFAALFAMRRLGAPLVIASVEALMTRTVARAIFDESIVRIAPGERLDLELLVETMAAMGYQRTPQCEESGDFSVRGGIIDAFPPLYRHPVRIELEDDLVRSIRHFEVANQRSMGELGEATIIRARYVAAGALKEKALADKVALRAAEIGMVRKEAAELAETLQTGLLFPGAELLAPYVYGAALDSVFAYVPDGTLAWLVDPGRIIAEAARFSDLVGAEAAAAAAKPSFFPPRESLYMTADELERHLDRLTAVEVGSLITVTPPREGWATAVEVNSAPALRLGSAELTGERQALSFEPLAAQLNEVRRGQARAVMVVEGANQAARLRRHLEAYEIEVATGAANFRDAIEQSDFRPAIIDGEISAGVALEADGLYIYSEPEIFGEPRARRRSKPAPGAALLNLEELRPADLVVHLDHGIGRYRGLKHLKVAGAEGDFLNLEYAGDDTMYVPVERINLVQRYVGGGGDGAEPRLDKLGSGSWERVKRRTKKAVLAMAKELLEIYAAREVMEGHAFPNPGADYEEFAAHFEFEETPDQQAAIDDVIRDMAAPKPMDRLICGDAGFGKTEVAVRAAFVAVMDARQVAILAPTTILAEQHWNTLCARFKDYPVRVEMVSRFRSARENKATLDGLSRGTVDIVVGTHRILQRGTEFARLGLLVIDEEHRFGVADKEKLKKLRKLVDVLTLTATPIPRTMHMALLGIRDLSVIQTPPPDRQAIRTFVAHFDDALVREVSIRELNRGGQVFFVHNRVENIDYVARHLRALLPEARIAVAHGQMNERALERVMRDFIDKRVNLLVSTAIIESGLDIPNANTMIVNRADRFGLAQLYQLRGRVGRSRQRAYVYLLIPGEHIITRDAKRRIEALRELVESDRGGGFRLAMADLEHRGAGNLLGREQSGQITAVGFELYTQMMQEAIHELRGEVERPEFEPELRLGVPAYIPAAYVADENERVALYRRLARARAAEELAEMCNEMRDRFGPIPTLVGNLIAAMDVRRQMRALMVASATLKAGQLELKFHPSAPVDVARLAALVQANRKRMRLSPSYQVTARIEPAADGDYGPIFAQVEAVLQAVGGCENLEAEPRPAANRMPN
jgi:transcription-repair coupling factor (superfamily II helicase)